MAPPRTRSSSGPRRPLFRRVVKWVIVAVVLGFLALAAAVAIAMASLPGYDELKSSPNGQMVRVHAVDGTVIVSLGPSYGRWLPYAQIPQVMKDAMTATEDRRFRMHPGVDPIGIARSLWVRVKTGRWAQGGSTITQQITRNIFLTNTKTFARKFREIILALAMERKFSKDQILELYLNRVYFGGGAYGIDAASRRFFGHPANTLDLPEAAIIAGLVKAPSNYSPTADAQAAIGRAGVVLDLMREQGKISAVEEAAADPHKVKLAPEPRQNSVRYFTDWALSQLDTMIDNTTDPIEVWTTLDLKMQRAADDAIRANAPKGVQGALVSLDRDGAVRAMVGGTDYVSSIYNRATQAVRQPGSSFKLFVYLAALEAGHRPEDRVVDEPIDIDGWRPRNSSGRFAGEMDIRTAFAFSVNTIAAKLGSEVGFDTVADMARRFGITTPVNTHPSMVLGTSDVRLIDMTRAYAAVAANGVAITPYGITKVTTASGDVLYQHEVDTSRVLVAPYVAQQMTDLLQTAVATGTGRAAQIGRPVAGKTGTTSSNKDGWFLGFSSGLTTGVWMGRDDARPVGGLAGGRAPARAFAAFMKVAVASRPVEKFNTEVTLPEWQLEPDEEAYFGAPDENLIDENGVGPADDALYPGGPQAPPAEEHIEAPPRLDEQWLDNVLHRGAPPSPPGERRPPDGSRESRPSQ
ncbi:MAG TPA: PBP1A family penicillin-binding protein [Sphingomonadaceae bacterium]|nr:PBP1A family penicillin-binding protein [Sphingomonadaceae bacterium]